MVRVLIVGLYDKLGGIESFVYNYYNNLDKDKIQYDFINAHGSIYFQNYYIAHGSIIYDLPDVKKKPLLYQKRLIDIMKNYNIVHINILSAANFIPVRAAKLAGVKKIIVHSHNSETVGFVRKCLHNIFKSYVRINATHFFACSELAGMWMFGKKIVHSNKFYIINNGIDIKKLEFNNESRNRVREFYNLKDKLVIGHVGRFAKQKNHYFLIDIFREIYASNKNARLLLVGDGELRKSIEEKCRNLGLWDAVRFCGVCENINEMYSAMDVFVMPSLFEGLAVALIEAQAAGLKCVVSDTLSLESNVSGNVDFVSLDDKPTVWAEKVISASKCIQRTKISMPEYDIKCIAKKLRDIYLER